MSPAPTKGQPVSGLQRRTHGAEDIGVAARQMSHGQGSPGLRDLGAEIGGGAARDGRLAGRIDVEQKKAVGEAQRGGKIGLEPGRPAKTVRLENDHEPARRALAQAGEQRPDFGRMMRVILEDGQALRDTEHLLPSAGTRIVRQQIPRQGRAHQMRRRQRRRRIVRH